MQKLSGAKHWFHEQRFGMFVHRGIYAGGGIHEQHQMRLHVPAAEYQKYAAQFNPVKFDPAEWLDLAQETGMEDVVFTAKHHDGFCMWNTKETDYINMNTPYGKDDLQKNRIRRFSNRNNWNFCQKGIDRGSLYLLKDKSAY